MSWVSFRDSVEAKAAAFGTWWSGTLIGQEIDAGAKAAIAELESLGQKDLTTIAEATATGALTGLASGGTAGAIAGGITAAELAFKAAAKDVATQTLTTFATTVANKVMADQAAATTVVPAKPAA